jgi:glycosyltransferase involved in cell wall biosynthesis
VTTVLSVGYPLAPVGEDAVGGAEQVLTALDRALVAAGHQSIVVAPEASTVAGLHEPTPRIAGPFDEGAKLRAQGEHAAAIRRALRRWPVDLVHLHGIDFWAYLPPPGPAVLVTLHLPLAWYPAAALRPARPRTFLHAVSASQRRLGPPDLTLLDDVPNGVDVDRFGGCHAKRSFALMLGRICPEKGVHLALEAATLADCSLLIGGAVYPYAEHEAYFRTVVAPRLDSRRRFLGPLGLARKRHLLAAARCLLVPSLCPETSSLVAMEALASGTPVVAFRDGALPEIVEHGQTGFIVDSVEEMAEAMASCERIDPRTCREHAVRRFGQGAMVERYFRLYDEIIRSPADAAVA